MQRAREYADALDTTLDALVELTDTGPENHAWMRHEGHRGMTRAGYAGGGTDDPAPALDLEPERQQVQAAVNAGFTLHPPAL